MSTRGLMGVRVDGEDKLAYNHSDSSPGKLGADIVADIKWFLRKGGGGVRRMKELARALRFVSGAPTSEEIYLFKRYANLNVNEETYTDWYCLLRGLQGDFKETLQVGVIKDSRKFIEESLFCEWAYIVNLDEETLEVYRGFQDKRHKRGRYAAIKPSMAADRYPPRKSDAYWPCALLVTFPLRKIPSDFAKCVEKLDKRG